MKIEEGQDYYFWQTNLGHPEKAKCLAHGTIYKCEKCQALSHVNAVWILDNGDTYHMMAAKVQADAIGLIDSELCYSEETELNTCEGCYYTIQRVVV